MKLVEVTTDEAIEILRNSKNKKVMIAVTDLEHEEDEPSVFNLCLKQDCEHMIQDAETVASMCDDFVKQLRLFSEKQKDLKNIRHVGLQRTILLRE